MNALRNIALAAGFAVAAAALVLLLASAGPMPGRFADAVRRLAGVGPYPDSPGWMDCDGPLSDDDRARIADIVARARPNSVDVIADIQAGVGSDLSRRDFELLRQDRRRAAAAYPDVAVGELVDYGWFEVDYRQKVPESYCSSGNYSSTLDPGGQAFLDGPCYLGFVRDGYRERTDGPTATRVLAERMARAKAERAGGREEKGYHFAAAGSGGSLVVDCEAGGKCVVTKAGEWATRGTRYTFDYVPSEWGGDPLAYESLPSFKGAVSEEVDVTPSGVTVETHVGTRDDKPQTHGDVSRDAPPPAVPQER
jgi:hypothetical protein